jgi:hypothetical protein
MLLLKEMYLLFDGELDNDHDYVVLPDEEKEKLDIFEEVSY